MNQNNEAKKIVELSPPPTKNNGALKDDSMKKMIVFSALGIVLGIVACISYYWFVYSLTHVSTNNSYVEADIWPVNSRMMGYVKDIPVDEGQEVKKGDVLFVLDDSDLQIELAFKQAKFQKAQADVNRGRALKKSDIVSESDLELADAGLTGARADLDATLLKIKFTKIVSPTDGTVAKISIHPNQFIQPGQNLMMVVSKNSLWVKANFKETQLAKVRKGMRVDLDVDAFPGIVWHGEVGDIYPSSGATLSLIPPENATGNFTKIVQRIPVKIKIERKEGYDLKPGMSVVSTILLQ